MRSRAALMMPGGWAPSKLRKILLNKCIAPCRDRHAAAANFAQLLNHRLHLCDLSSLWIWTPKQSPGSAIEVVILHLFGQHETFLLQWLLIQPRAWPTLCRDSSGPCSLLLYMTQLIPKSKSIYFLTFTRTSILHSKRNFPVSSIPKRTAAK